MLCSIDGVLFMMKTAKTEHTGFSEGCLLNEQRILALETLCTTLELKIETQRQMINTLIKNYNELIDK